MKQIINNKNNVAGMFESIANKYDLLNNLLSLGIDTYWRKQAAGFADAAEYNTMLDMCCGTGDFAFEFARQYPQIEHTTGCDLSENMIDLAQQKEKRFRKKHPNRSLNFHWLTGDCLETGFDENNFDLVTCCFGVRNMQDLQKGLIQMHRLLRPGGKVCILEFSMPKSPLIKLIYKIYLTFMIPLAGLIIANNYRAYRYLAETVIKWSKQVDLAAEMKKTGFIEVNAKPLTFGVSTVYTAIKR